MRQFALVDAASGAARYLPATAPLDDGGGACRQAATLAREHGPLPAVLLTTSVTVISTITNANHSSQGEYRLSRDRIWRGARRPPAGRARDGRVPADGAATTRRARSGDGPGARLFLFRSGMSSPSASRVKHRQHRRQFGTGCGQVTLDGCQGLPFAFADAHHRHLCRLPRPSASLRMAQPPSTSCAVNIYRITI